MPNIYRTPRIYTNTLLEAVDDGIFDKDELISNLLYWMSEQEVKEFVERNDFAGVLGLEEDDEENEEY